MLLPTSVFKARPSTLKMEAQQDFPKWTNHSSVVETEVVNLSEMLLLIFLPDLMVSHSGRQFVPTYLRIWIVWCMTPCKWQIAVGVSESFAASIFREWAGQEERHVCALSYDIVYTFRSSTLSSWFYIGWVMMEDSWELVARGILMKRKILMLKLLLLAFLLDSSYTPLQYSSLSVLAQQSTRNRLW